MNTQWLVSRRGGMLTAVVLIVCEGIAGQPGPDIQKAPKDRSTVSLNATLDRMLADGKSQRELAQHVFDTRGCNQCHTTGKDGKLGFTVKGKEKAQGFQGCIATLKAISIIAKTPEDQRSAAHRRRVQQFEEFGCSTCHQITPGKVLLTEIGAKLAVLHLGCVEVQAVLADSRR